MGSDGDGPTSLISHNPILATMFTPSRRPHAALSPSPPSGWWLLSLLLLLSSAAPLAASPGAEPLGTPVPPPRHPTFPPQSLVETPDRTELAAWYLDNAYAARAPTEPLPDRDRQLLSWTAAEYIAARRSGAVTCAEYVGALLRQMLFLEDTQQFMRTTYSSVDQIAAAARDMDLRAETEGVEALAPLYGLPVPMKGTMATTDFPSSAGNTLLDGHYATKDAAFTTLFRQANAIVMGKTNVPDFAASWVTMNPSNGRTMNLYAGGGLTAGGSSGGSASAVAGHVAPVAVTEDTGGSTRHPAFQNGNFGYDPTRNHYPNQGNPGISYTNDQVGLNARSYGDILLVDAAVCGTGAAHAKAAEEVADRPAGAIRVGLPLHPFVDVRIPQGAFNFWGVSMEQPVSASACALRCGRHHTRPKAARMGVTKEPRAQCEP